MPAIRRFYERILGRNPSDEEWEMLDDSFHGYYVEYEKEAELRRGAMI